MNSAPCVTLGVPVYRGERFLRETLLSIQNQTHPEFIADISFDGADPECERICQPFLRDSRFRLTIQPERLGWARHLSVLMSRSSTPFWCYQQQDDLISPRYLEVLVNRAERLPEAAVVYCDLVSFGSREGTIAQPSVVGPPAARQLTLIHSHHPAVAFRGLTRKEALEASGGVPTNEFESFACDTAGMSAIATWGELHRVPAPLYRKRYHENNVHTKWGSWPLPRRRQAWTVHSVDMLQQAMRVESTPQERRLLWSAAVMRLAAPRAAPHFVDPGSLRCTERSELLERFFAEAFARPTLDLPTALDADRAEIERWTRGFLWSPRVDCSENGAV